MLTRLHLRYTRDSLPEDLVFQETQDRTNFQARYVLRHPWAGSVDACAEAKPYFDAVRRRQEREAQTLASLTGWDLASRSARAWRCRRSRRSGGGSVVERARRPRRSRETRSARRRRVTEATRELSNAQSDQ